MVPKDLPIISKGLPMIRAMDGLISLTKIQVAVLRVQMGIISIILGGILRVQVSIISVIFIQDRYSLLILN